jgi:uncharacterized repeat protein (TIGR01451 family)
VLGALGVLVAAVGTSQASHLGLGFPDTEGHTTLNQILSPSEDPVAGYTTLDAEQVNEDYELRDGANGVTGAPVADPNRADRRVSLAYFSQMTDFQVADEESPARVEFLDQGPSAAWRPQEAMVPFMVDASVKQLNRFAGASPVPQGNGTGNAMDMALITGDQADSMQRNETKWVRDILEGDVQIKFNSGLSNTADYANPASLGASCPLFVTQEGGAAQAAAEGAKYTGVQDYDDYPVAGNPYFYDPSDPQGSWLADGWPTYPDLMDRAQQITITPHGLDVPFYMTNGNHDVLVQGNEDANQAFEQIATGCFKALGTTATPPTTGPDPDPDVLLLPTGGGMLVPPDPQRQYVSKPQIKEIYEENEDHGFSKVDPDENAASNGAASYFAWDPPETPGFRFISVDTNSEGGQTAEGVGCGSAAGNIDNPQFLWLKDELDKATEDGKLVVMFGHHPVRSMCTEIADEQAPPCLGNDSHDHDINPGCDVDPRLSTPLHLGEDPVPGDPRESFVELLDGYPNVLAYVAGHTHEHRLIPFTRSDDTLWWEVNTSAVVDNPTQSRLVELMDNRDGTLSIFGTTLNHASDSTAPPSGASHFDRNQLASIGRTFAWNDPQLGSPEGEGNPNLDQNAEMLLDDPREADLSIEKNDSPDPVGVDEPLTYTLTVTNEDAPNMAALASGVTVTDDLPSGVEFVSADASQGSCSESGGQVTCNIGDILRGDSETVTIVVRPQSAGSISNEASVDGVQPDPVSGNDSDTEGTTVEPPKCGGNDPTIVGTQNDDNMTGTPERDTMVGLAGDDLMRGKPKRDCLNGGTDEDELHGGSGPDDLWGKEGDDEFFAVGGNHDTIHCGPGNDRVHAGRNDNVGASCEQVTRGR